MRIIYLPKTFSDRQREVAREFAMLRGLKIVEQ